jgi:hypothetical protein
LWNLVSVNFAYLGDYGTAQTLLAISYRGNHVIGCSMGTQEQARTAAGIVSPWLLPHRMASRRN